MSIVLCLSSVVSKYITTDASEDLRSDTSVSMAISFARPVGTDLSPASKSSGLNREAPKISEDSVPFPRRGR